MLAISGNSCDTVDCQASCAPPPAGEIVPDKINVVTTILIINNDGEAIQIDGPIELVAGGDRIDLANYTWAQIGPEQLITALRVTVENVTYTVVDEKFTFINMEAFEAGSFLINIRLDSSDTTISNDLLFLRIAPFDGSCDPDC